jgi:hypothetical protein
MNNRLRMRLRARIPKFGRKEVTTMVVLNGGIAFLMALNLAINTAVGLMVLLHCPHVMRPMPIKWPYCLRDKPNLKAEEKGDKSNEQNLG